MIKQRGKYVSRAVYAKLQAENKRLLADIKIMVIGAKNDSMTIYYKWKIKFEQERAFNDALRIIAKKELPKLRKKFGMKALIIFLIAAICSCSSCSFKTCPANAPGKQPLQNPKPFKA